MIYRIVCDGVDLYGPDVEHSVLNPHLEIELNAAGTLEFTLPIVMGDDDGKYQQINGDIWRSPNVFKSEIWVFEEDRIIWFGRPLQITRDWNNQRRVVCEGALAYFNDSIQRTWEMKPKKDHSNTNISFFRHIITNHNLQVDTNREFSIGNITVESEDAYRKTDYDTTYDCLQNMCLAVNGGYIILRKEYTYDNWHSYIDWVSEMPEESVQPVEFGLNMLDVNQDLNGADVCTVLIATGKDDCTFNELGDITPSEETDWIGHDAGSDEIWHQKGVERFGRVVQQKSWNEFTATGGRSSGLWHKATDWLINKNKEITTIEVSAADLHYIGDYADQADYNFFRVGMKVSVISGPHDLQQKELIIYKLSMDLDTGVKKVTIGTPPKRELTDIIAPNSGSGSTRGSGSTGGGDGGSSSGSGGGGGSVTIPVKDVQVKMPGEDDYSSVVTKKIAKIDLSDISGGGSVEDVKVNGVSVVDPTTHEADIQLPEVPVQDVQVDGVSVVDEDGIADISSVINDNVVDVTIDGVSIKDPNDHIAKIISDDFFDDNEALKAILSDYEHIVNYDHSDGTKEIINPTFDIPKTILKEPTDLVVEVSKNRVYDHEDVIFSSSDQPSNMNPGDYYAMEQYINAPPHLYVDEHGVEWWDPGEGQNFILNQYHKFSGGSGAETVLYNTDYSAFDVKFYYTSRVGTSSCFGTIWNSTMVEYEYHGVPMKPTSVHPPKQPVNGDYYTYSAPTSPWPVTPKLADARTMALYGSHDGETLELIFLEGTDHDVYMIDCDDYYEHLWLRITSGVSADVGWVGNWHLDGIKKSEKNYINQIWYKYDNFEWICQDVSHVVANPSGTATNDLTKLQIDNTIYNIPIPTVIDVEANPSGSTIGDLTSIQIGQYSYDIPVGTEVEANPSDTTIGDLNSIKIGSYAYDIPSGGGGTTVIGNPQGTPSYVLNSIQIGNDIFSVPSGGGGSSHTWSTTAQQVGTWIDGTTVYEKSFYITNLTANAWTDVAHGISGIGKVIDIRGTVTLASSGGAYATCDDYKFRCQSSNLGVYCGSGTPDYAIVVLTYTLGSGNNTRYQIVSKDTTGYDAAITVNKFVNNVLISSTDYRYDDIFSPVTIDNKIQIVYNDSPYQYTYTLLAASADHASGYSYSWDYDQSVDISETFT